MTVGGFSMLGLSPRVRGNQIAVGLDAPSSGSIPACAGEPHLGGGQVGPIRVYPRVCGGTDRAKVTYGSLVGLSPRVRGNRLAAGGNHRGDRSIPACAGEPSWSRPTVFGAKVYPRVCGGTHR